MGYHDDGLVVLAGHGLDEVHDFYGRVRIKVAGRLVGEDDIGLRDESSRDSHTLLLSAGHLLGLVLHTPSEPDLFEDLSRKLPALSSADSLEDERKLDIFKRRHGSDQVVGLENKSEVFLPELAELVLAHLPDRLALYEDLPGRELLDPCHEVKER